VAPAQWPHRNRRPAHSPGCLAFCPCLTGWLHTPVPFLPGRLTANCRKDRPAPQFFSLCPRHCQSDVSFFSALFRALVSLVRSLPEFLSSFWFLCFLLLSRFPFLIQGPD